MVTDSLTSSATSVSNNDSSWVDLSVEGSQKEERHNPGVEDQSDQGSNTATTLEFQLTQALLDRVKANIRIMEMQTLVNKHNLIWAE